MIKNYLKITLRNVRKYAGYSAINVFGLAIGIACCLLIFMYVNDEFTYDRYHSKADRVYRIVNNLNFGGRDLSFSNTSVIEGKTFAEEIPEIEQLTRFNNASGLIQIGDDYLEENGFLYADPAIFKIFDFQLLGGDLNTSLSDLNGVVLTESIADKYFSKTDVVGELLNIKLGADFEAFKVTAVVEDHPVNSSFNFDLILPFSKYEASQSPSSLTTWGQLSVASYFLLREGVTSEVVIDKMTKVRHAHHPDSNSFMRKIHSDLQNLPDIHLNPDIGGGTGLSAASDPVYSYVLSGIAFLILIIACINFTNLTVAQSLPRAKEIGIRKVVGAVKRQLSFQFLTETFLMCSVAFIIGMVIAEFLIPFFGELTEKKLNLSLFDNIGLLLSSFSIVLITAFISGFYPAFVVSKFNVVNCLKGSVSVKGKRYITKGLVVAQFTIATVLIIGALSMRGQIDHMINKDLGYNDQSLYQVDASRLSKDMNLLNLFRGELEADPNVLKVSGSSGYGSAIGIKKSEDEEEFLVNIASIDRDYLGIKRIELLEGRLLLNEPDQFIDGEDTLTNVLVNKAFLRKMDFDEALGKRFDKRYRIVGVVPDYHLTSVKAEIPPLVLFSLKADESNAGQIFVKFAPAYLPEIRQKLEATWRKFTPFFPFEGEMLSERNKGYYEDEVRWNRIISLSSTLAIVISCMGLLGLAHLGTQQRAKEIGIRKVLGATVGQIILLLNSSFVKLVLISIIIAMPIAYFAVNKWLNSFISHIDISVPLLLIPGILTLLIAIITVSILSVKSANSNPVDSLRYE